MQLPILPHTVSLPSSDYAPLGKQNSSVLADDPSIKVFSPVEEVQQVHAKQAIKQGVDPEPIDPYQQPKLAEDPELSQLKQNLQEKERVEQEQLVKDLATIEKLARLDREVHLHEQAHQSAGGQYAGAASYTYAQGPDGQRYAVAGEVSISAPSTNDPAQTIAQAEQIRRAALAPLEPSATDLQVAANATRLELQAQQDLAALQRREIQEQDESRSEETEERKLENDEQAQKSEERNVETYQRSRESIQTYSHLNQLGQLFSPDEVDIQA